ncbi:uncharacterized protein LOC132919076 [Rhopalosiphum padi]|uniref:uncharacterized protein LOC132919076 n=1 Tax=Rhopalosiphum padi TaxID=40932 RepID=UPI00298E45E6|nr:uncharacterized protein LOC132919076 [Rhopalosiphum padi]
MIGRSSSPLDVSGIASIHGEVVPAEDDKQWLKHPDQIQLAAYAAILTAAGFNGKITDIRKTYKGDSVIAIQYMAFLRKTNFISDNYMKKFAVQRIDFPLQDWTKDDENHSTSVSPEDSLINWGDDDQLWIKETNQSELEIAIEYMAFLRKTKFISDNYMKLFGVHKMNFPNINWTEDPPKKDYASTSVWRH